MYTKLAKAFDLREQVKKQQAKAFRLSIFDEGDGGGTDPADDGADDEPRTFTAEEVDALVKRKKAEWEKTQKKQTDKATKSANDRIADLEKELAGMQAEKARGELVSGARALLQAEDVNVSDAVIANLIREDADATEAEVKAFVAAYRADVAAEVKKQLAGKEPKKGSGGKLTKEEILKVQNRAERQRLIRENMDLF